MNQIACKVAPALATGCTMVLKPSEIAPFSAQIWTEILHAAGVPAGVVQPGQRRRTDRGRGHRQPSGVDMVSFTGSTGAGIGSRATRRRRSSGCIRSWAASRQT